MGGSERKRLFTADVQNDALLPFIIIIIKQENNEWRIVKD